MINEWRQVWSATDQNGVSNGSTSKPLDRRKPICQASGPFMSNSVQWWLYDHFDVKLSKTNTIWRYTLSDCKILLKRNGSPVFIMDQWQTAFSEVFSSSYPYPHWASMPFHTHRCLDTLYHWNTFTFKLLLCKYLFCFKDFFYISMVKYMLNLWQRLLVQKWPSSWNCNQKMYVC